MGAYRRKYTREFKIEMVESSLQGHTILEVAKNNDLSPGLITRWKRHYLDGKFHGNSTSDIARSMSHAPTSVDRYIRDFERVKMLNLKGMSQSEISYITSLSESLVIEYIKIIKEQMLKN